LIDGAISSAASSAGNSAPEMRVVKAGAGERGFEKSMPFRSAARK